MPVWPIYSKRTTNCAPLGGTLSLAGAALVACASCWRIFPQQDMMLLLWIFYVRGRPAGGPLDNNRAARKAKPQNDALAPAGGQQQRGGQRHPQAQAKEAVEQLAPE